MLADFSQCTENFPHWSDHQAAWNDEESLNVVQTFVSINFSIPYLVIMDSFLSDNSFK